MTASTRRELRSAATSTSTTAIGLIRALTDARLIKPTSTRCLSARRPNPGRGSTYRRGNPVQTTAATSLHYPELLTGTYIHHYDALLYALSANAPSGAAFAFTGVSLGGAATNLMADIAGDAFGGRFAAATFVGFASPIISTAAGILNLGFENDPVYKAINGYADFPSSLDNLVLATSEYMAGNYDGFLPLDYYAHSSALGFEALSRLSQSVFSDVMTPDSVVIFDANSGFVQDVTPGRANAGAFYLGENVADSIAGRNGNDFLERSEERR